MKTASTDVKRKTGDVYKSAAGSPLSAEDRQEGPESASQEPSGRHAAVAWRSNDLLVRKREVLTGAVSGDDDD